MSHVSTIKRRNKYNPRYCESYPMSHLYHYIDAHHNVRRVSGVFIGFGNIDDRRDKNITRPTTSYSRCRTISRDNETYM